MYLCSKHSRLFWECVPGTSVQSFHVILGKQELLSRHFFSRAKARFVNVNVYCSSLTNPTRPEVEVLVTTVRQHNPQSVHQCPCVHAAVKLGRKNWHRSFLSPDASKMREVIPSSTFKPLTGWMILVRTVSLLDKWRFCSSTAVS
jgi:hypothetical protein